MTDPEQEASSLTREQAQEALLKARRIHTACENCHGVGGLLYHSTATWRGSVGGRVKTWDVCDLCWGSGDSERPWTNLRALQSEEDRRVAERAWSYFADGLGTDLSSLAASLVDLAKEIERIRCPSPSKRKSRPQFFHNVCAHLERLILEGVRVSSDPVQPIPQPSPDKARQLWAACMEWREKVDPICQESIYQSDHVHTACPKLAVAVMEVLGYANRCGCGERCSDLVCDACSGRSES